MFRTFKQWLAALVLVLTGVPAAQAENFNPHGIWEPPGKEARYRVTLCGDGSQLCALVVYIRPDQQTERNKKYIGTYLFEKLPRTGPNRWRGQVTLEDTTINGTVEMVGRNELKVTGCVLLVLCDNLVMTRR
ncbi:DUF2147 domain-containing protein [Cucumibacter marinus]|uniref:DUF2147 domain-containing protein n=1 Tax=Cucumibacter marinus TaxID=1121252 RepID=UPI000425AA1F|nr:DUF2147 domain-containing protein [Cucumibacter marinus]